MLFFFKNGKGINIGAHTLSIHIVFHVSGKISFFGFTKREHIKPEEAGKGPFASAKTYAAKGSGTG